MNKINTILFSLLGFSISIIILILHTTSNTYYTAKEVYRVYLDGKSIGLIKSKKELENYIDIEQKSLKEKYNVERVYAPTGLEIKEEITYNEDITSTEDIYNKVKETENFTIPGYKVTIIPAADDKDKETLYLYLLDKSILSTAVNETVKSFIDEEKYNLYLQENQEEITDTGSIIENVYVKEK